MNWLREQQFALSAAWSRLCKAPGSFSFNVLVIAMALVLPLAGMTLLENLRPVSRELAVDPEMTVFWPPIFLKIKPWLFLRNWLIQQSQQVSTSS